MKINLKEFIKENWFKIIIILLLVIFIILYYNEQNKKDKIKTSSPAPTIIYTNPAPAIISPKQNNQEPIAPVNNNLDSTCLSFYEKMKALDVPVVKTIPTYTSAELEAIDDVYAGNYNPAVQSVWAKQRTADKLYTDTISGNIAQKKDLAIKYGFCYEYLSRTYGFIINN